MAQHTAALSNLFQWLPQRIWHWMGGEWQLKISESQRGPQITEQLVGRQVLLFLPCCRSSNAHAKATVQVCGEDKSGKDNRFDVFIQLSCSCCVVWERNSLVLPVLRSTPWAACEAWQSTHAEGRCGWTWPSKGSWETKDEVLERSFPETALILSEIEGAGLGGWNKT